MIGIMQGRLSSPEPSRFQAFPRREWPDEFPRAAEAGLDSIEWIFDVYGEGANPIESDSGLARIRALSESSGVRIRSLCADYFMERPLLRCTEAELSDRIARLCWLLCRCQAAEIERIVLPFVDRSAIENAAELDAVAGRLSAILNALEETQVEIHLETALEPDVFAKFLKRLEHPMIRVNYDCGNSASLGFRPKEEFESYGNRVGSVHIKDRRRGGGTVPLGEGDVDFPSVFGCLDKVGFRGDFILQAARGEPGREVALAAENRRFVERWIHP